MSGWVEPERVFQPGDVLTFDPSIEHFGRGFWRVSEDMQLIGPWKNAGCTEPYPPTRKQALDGRGKKAQSLTQRSRSRD